MDIFKGLFDGDTQSVISITDFLLCVAVSLAIGGFLALICSFRSHHTKSFLITLGVLPAIVCIVIMMVNGNIGAGVAVAGAFSLVRFRSAPGTAKEIAILFLAMASGLIAGMGYLAYAVLFAIILGVVLLLCNIIKLPVKINKGAEKTLKITIPEDLDYTDLFKDIFDKYTKECNVVAVKTTNMGSMFKITYNIVERDTAEEKKMIDEIRTRNGNLEISISELENRNDEL
jgi:hypothetical protein